MHVCYLTSHLSRKDGWGTYSVGIVEGMLDRGVACTVLMPVGATSILEHPRLTQLPVLTSFGNDPTKPLRLARDWLRSAPHVRGCDLIHCLAEPLGALGACISGRTHPFVMSAVGTHAIRPLRFALYGTLLRIAYRRARHIVCISDYTRRVLVERTALSKTSTVPLGVDLTLYPPPSLPVAPSSRPVLLGVGSVKPRKGYHVSIRAFAEVLREFPEARYLIAGEVTHQSYMQVLNRIVEEHGLQKSVKFLGKVSHGDLLSHYRNCDLFVLTPINEQDHFEGFGLVYLEANANGKPVVGSLDCGAETAVAHGFSGLLVPQEDHASVARAICDLLGSAELYRQMARQARQHAEGMTWNDTADRLMDLYAITLGYQGRCPT